MYNLEQRFISYEAWACALTTECNHVCVYYSYLEPFSGEIIGEACEFDIRTRVRSSLNGDACASSSAPLEFNSRTRTDASAAG